MNNSDAKGIKIAFVHSKYSTVGGTEKYLYVISKELAKRGAEIDFFVSSIETKVLPGIRCHCINTIKKPSSAFLLSFLLNSSSALKKGSFNIIQSSGKTAPADIYRLGGGLHIDYLSRKPGNNLPLKPYHLIVKMLERNIFEKKRFKKIISPSKRVKDLLINKYNIEEKNIEVLYNPILEEVVSEERKKNLRSDFREKHGIKDNDICYLFVAGNFRLKGLGELINAYTLLPDNLKKKSRIIVTGGGKKNRYMTLLKKRGLEDRFIFTGELLKERLKEVFSAGDALVHPTYYDPFSNVCLEAMSYGLPVITTEINGFSEIMENEIHGYTVPDPGDSSKISSLMEKLSNREIRMKMLESCILKSKDFTVESHIDRLLEIYREVDELKKREKT